MNGGHDALVARSLEGVQTCPVGRQVDLLKDVDTDRRAGGAKNQCRVAKIGAPASVDEHSVDVALQPAAFESVELMMVGATWREGPVRSQALEGPVHTMPTVSPALSVVHGHVTVWRMPTWAIQVQLAVAADTTPPSSGPSALHSRMVAERRCCLTGGGLLMTALVSRAARLG